MCISHINGGTKVCHFEAEEDEEKAQGGNQV
jgi:hypothetical protein